MIAISLERLGALHWIPALALFVLLVLLALGLEARRRGQDGGPSAPEEESGADARGGDEVAAAGGDDARE